MIRFAIKESWLDVIRWLAQRFTLDMLGNPQLDDDLLDLAIRGETKFFAPLKAAFRDEAERLYRLTNTVGKEHFTSP